MFVLDRSTKFIGCYVEAGEEKKRDSSHSNVSKVISFPMEWSEWHGIHHQKTTRSFQGNEQKMLHPFGLTTHTIHITYILNVFENLFPFSSL